MTRVTYQGPYEAVYVPAIGAIVAQGETVEFPDELAQLVTQTPDWVLAEPATEPEPEPEPEPEARTTKKGVERS